MRILIRVVWLVVFLLLFAFAVTNTANTELRITELFAIAQNVMYRVASAKLAQRREVGSQRSAPIWLAGVSALMSSVTNGRIIRTAMTTATVNASGLRRASRRARERWEAAGT